MRPDVLELLSALNEFESAARALETLFPTQDVDSIAVNGESAVEKVSGDCEDVSWEMLTQVLRYQNVRDDCVDVAEMVADLQHGQDEQEKIEEVDVSNCLLTVMGKPALLFATSLYDDELALQIWRGMVRYKQSKRGQNFDLLRQVLDNTKDSHNLCSLHYAIEAQMDDFISQVVTHFSIIEYTQGEKNALGVLLPEIVAQDVVFPVGKNQIQGKHIATGGATVLHYAAQRGDLLSIKKFVEPPISMRTHHKDLDGNTALQRAMLHQQPQVIDYLNQYAHQTAKEIPDPEDVTTKKLQRDEIAKARYISSLEPAPSMLQPSVFTQIWSSEECAAVLKTLDTIVSRRGWCSQRHAAYQTTDLPSYHVIPIDPWVRHSIQSRLFPLVHAQYALPPTQELQFRELFYVKYEVKGCEQSELALHCDGSVLSFNILLNDANDFKGGGTYFESLNKTITIEKGDAAVHSGKVRHAGAPLIHGRRFILVGFLNLVEKSPWGPC